MKTTVWKSGSTKAGVRAFWRQGFRLRPHWLGTWPWGRHSELAIVEIRTPELRLPLVIPLPLGWLADTMQGAAWCVQAYEWLRLRAGAGSKTVRFSRQVERGGGHRAGGYVGDWLERHQFTLGKALLLAARLLQGVRDCGSFTLVDVAEQQARLRIRLV